MATMLLSTHGTNGDVLSFVRLGAELAERGHDVTIATHARYAPTVRAADIELVPIDTEDEYVRYLADARDMLDARVGSPRLPDLLGHYQRNDLFGQLRREVEAAVARHRAGATVLVGRHTSGLATLIAAELLGAPSVWVAMTPAQQLLLPVQVHLHRSALAAGIDAVRADFGLAPVDDWAAWMSGADRQLGLWPRWFDKAGPPTVEAVEPVGFLLNDAAESGDLPPEVERILADPSGPPVLVAASSGQMLWEPFYAAALYACRRVGRPVILVSPHLDALPDPLPAGVRWFPRLPYRDLVPRVAAVIHHGGIGTLGRCIAAGVPQVVLAHSFDQPDTGARLQRCGVARFLPSTRWAPETAAELLTEVLTDARYAERSRRFGATVDPTTTATRAAERIEALLAPSPEPVDR
ncbi:nucleotide disphospho-sugar-binding domain-containing protein [Micromonospora sp. NPDC023956]|uniref:glycosyltransferase n=1 Tax=Micromonospora sp. NPDC023956 TaxID=3155722 RepID=UPI0033D38064